MLASLLVLHRGLERNVVSWVWHACMQLHLTYTIKVTLNLNFFSFLCWGLKLCICIDLFLIYDQSIFKHHLSCSQGCRDAGSNPSCKTLDKSPLIFGACLLSQTCNFDSDGGEVAKHGWPMSWRSAKDNTLRHHSTADRHRDEHSVPLIPQAIV